MRRTLYEISVILAAAVVIALITNTLSPAGIPLQGQWDQEKGVVRADPDDPVARRGLEIDQVQIAKQIYDQGKTLFVDARSRDDYDKGHVKGAVSLPVGEFDAHIEDFINKYPPEQAIIIYCAGRTCEDSHHLAEDLMGFGYENVRVMIDGFPGWVAKGYPVEQ